MKSRKIENIAGLKFTSDEISFVESECKRRTKELEANGLSGPGVAAKRVDFEEVFPPLAKRKKRMVAEWGERCPDYEPGCPACEAWKLWDFLPGEIPTQEEVEACIAKLRL
jgi:hypothetical protein